MAAKDSWWKFYIENDGTVFAKSSEDMKTILFNCAKTCFWQKLWVEKFKERARVFKNSKFHLNG